MAWSRCVRFRFRLITVLGIIAACAGMIWSLRVARAANAFTPGNVVIYRVGDGSGSLVNTGNPVFVDEYTPTGTLVQSIALPTATAGTNHRLIASGAATSEGLMTRSTDGQYLVLTGYDAPIPTTGLVGTTSASVPRSVGRIDANAAIDTTTALTDFASANNPRGVASTNGTDLWVGGAAGSVRYTTAGSTTSVQLSTTVTNIRAVEIFGGQLYNSDSSGTAVRLGKVGNGLPTTTGQTITNLPGFPASTGSPYAFFFADLSSSVNGVDTLYVADDGIGITKYSLVSGSWAANGTVGAAADSYRGLTGVAFGTTVTLYATRKGGSGAAGGGELVRFVDISGYNGAISGTPALLATASANTAFRGVSFAPGTIPTPTAPSITSNPAGTTIFAGATATLSVTATGSVPLLYQWYRGNASDTSTPVGTNSSTFVTPPLSTTTSYWVRVANGAGFADSNTATITVTAPPSPCSTPYIPINQVQGTGAISPRAGLSVTVRGVVVGDYEGPSPALRGFYLQDLAADYDSDPATSEGIFVFESNNADTVAVGQIVQVTGTATEFQGQTEIDTPAIESCGTTASVTPADVLLPVPAPVNGVSYLERFEGMLVRFHQTLYVTELFQLGQFGQIVMSSSGRLPQPTSIVLPGAQAQAIQAANDLNRIIVDDELQNQDPDPIKFGRGGNPLSASNTLRGGDSATDIVGVLTYTWAGFSSSGNAYRLRPINALGGGIPVFQPSNPRPPVPPNVNGRLKVVGMNVLNYFLTLDNNQSICGPVGHKQQCRGAETAQELSRQQAKLNQALIKLDADVIGMSELENTQDAQGNDVNPLADIVGRLNSSLGGSPYNYIDTGIAGTDTVRVGIIYKSARVTPVGAYIVDNNPIHNRAPVAQMFSENSTSERFTVIANHFRSKGCSSNPANPADNDQGDGQGCFNATRVKQSQALLTFINSVVIPATNDPDVLLVGDFNSYAKEDPIRTIEQGGFTNLVSRYAGPSAYSYVFDGEWGYIDHALASTSMLAQVGGTGDYHINADEPSALDYNILVNGVVIKDAAQIVSLYNVDEFRIADHDPVAIGLNLRPLPLAKPDSYTVEAGTTLNVSAGGNSIVSNDTGGPLSILSYTNTAHGTLALNADGSFSYTPAQGYFGLDTFTYTVSNGVQLLLYGTNLSPLATIGGVNITAGGYGSAVARVPGSPDEFYGLTDRGPNVDGPNATKVEPLPAFTPAIAKFKFSGSQAILEQTIPLRAADGTPYSGRVNSLANTGEVITDLNGNVLAADPNGYDSEGLVAMADGSFWVSDEYGPFITHFDASGKQIGRLSPFDGSLPRELARRVVNRGMEGLTITPDGTTLVGIMQSALDQADLAGFDAKKLAPIRIVTYRFADGALHEYLYLLDNPATTKTAASEITALSNTMFLVDERDGNFPPGAYKRIFKIDITGATDVGPRAAVAGAAYDGSNGGLLIAGKTIESLVKNLDTGASSAALASSGITPVSKSLYTDIDGLLTSVDSQGRFFSHDKLEGVAILNDGATLVISNDSDFGIDGVTNSTPPFQLHAKVSPVTGQQDDGEFLVIDSIRSTATVTINVADTIAPETALFSTPINPSGNTTATFTFGGSDNGSGVASFQCSLDGSTFAQCNSGISYSGLAGGSHTFAVRAIDGAGNVDSTPAGFGWTIQLIAANDAYTMDEDRVLTVAAPGVLGNDNRFDAPTFAAVLVSDPSHGTLKLNSDGSFTYTPVALFFGTDSFTYKASSGSLSSNNATVTITINHVNHPPVAKAGTAQTISCDADCKGTVTLDGSATDVDNDPLTFSWTEQPDGLSATGAKPTVAGLSKGVHTFTLTVSDGNGGTSMDTVSITVADTTPPSFTNVPAPIVVTQNAVGGATITVPAATARDNCGQVTITATVNGNPLPAVFPLGTTTITFTAKDSSGNPATATTTVTVNNAPPVARVKNVAVNAIGGCTAFASIDDGSSDPFGDPVTVTLNPPGPYGIGVTTVTLTVTDNKGASARATATVTVYDVTAPITLVSGHVPAPVNGWNNSNVTLSFTASDGCSAVKEVTLTWSGAQTGTTTTTGNTASVQISSEGTTTIVYSSRDVFGNAEVPKTYVVHIDKTAPEAFHQFDPVTKTVQVFGRDSGSGAASTGPVAGSCIQRRCTYTITDRAGNTLKFIEDVKQSGNGKDDEDDHDGEIQSVIVSLQYNGAAVIPAPENSSKFSWSTDKTGAIKELNQDFVVGKGKDKQQVKANFDAKEDETTIDDNRTDKTKKETRPGLILLRTASSRGSLAVEF